MDGGEHGNSKYHTVNSNGIYCKLEAKREKTRIRQQNFYYKWKHLLAYRKSSNNGSGSLPGTRHEDITIEEVKISRELKRLKLR